MVPSATRVISLRRAPSRRVKTTKRKGASGPKAAGPKPASPRYSRARYGDICAVLALARGDESKAPQGFRCSLGLPAEWLREAARGARFDPENQGLISLSPLLERAFGAPRWKN